MRFASLVAAAFVAVAPVAAFAADVTPLVTAEWLKAHAGDENVAILDIRDKVGETDLGATPYIANAVVAPYASAGWRTRSRRFACKACGHTADADANAACVIARRAAVDRPYAGSVEVVVSHGADLQSSAL